MVTRVHPHTLAQIFFQVNKLDSRTTALRLFHLPRSPLTVSEKELQDGEEPGPPGLISDSATQTLMAVNKPGDLLL